MQPRLLRTFAHTLVQNTYKLGQEGHKSLVNQDEVDKPEQMSDDKHGAQYQENVDELDSISDSEKSALYASEDETDSNDNPTAISTREAELVNPLLIEQKRLKA